jgi:hypothetical protein
MTLDAFLSNQEGLVASITRSAQDVLDSAGAGIQIERVVATDRMPPFAVQATYEQLQQAVTQANSRVKEAEQERNKMLLEAAGSNYPNVLELIDRYERAIVEKTVEGTDAPLPQNVLQEIFEYLTSDEMLASGGEVSKIVNAARSYRTQIAATLGSDARRFQGLLPQYRESPLYTVQRLWLDTYQRVMSRAGVETIGVSSGMGELVVNITSRTEVMDIRRKLDQDRREAEALQGAGFDRGRRRTFLDDENPFRLRIEDGKVRGRGEGD